jgi:hypothetical protein
MEAESLAEARAKAQDAMSRARLAIDPDAKKAWEDEAREWTERLTALEAAAGSSQTQSMVGPTDPAP